MVLGRFASLLKSSAVGLKASLEETSDFRHERSLALEGAGRVLLETLDAQLGESPEDVNQRSLLRHCAQAAQSALPSPEMMPAELIATMLTYFMVQTVLPKTCGVAYYSRPHPLCRLVESSPRFTAIRPGTANIDSLETQQDKISTAIVVVADSEAELLFNEKLLRPLIERITSNGVDVLVVADQPDRARRIANEAVPRGHVCWSINFPLLGSGIGLSGIALRCSSLK